MLDPCYNLKGGVMPLSKERNKGRRREQRDLNSVQPKLPDWYVHPNNHLKAHMAYCPDYDPLDPAVHWTTCPFINPALRPSFHDN